MKTPLSGKRQYGVICLRAAAQGEMEIVLITSRGSGRWVIPKGWPMRKKTPLEAATVEAYEEAGVLGRALTEEPVGTYRYRKVLRSGLTADLRVVVFAVEVDELLEDWPERAERRVEWFSLSEAAASVAEPGLAKLIKRLPRTLMGAGVSLSASSQT